MQFKGREREACSFLQDKKQIMLIGEILKESKVERQFSLAEGLSA